MTPRRHLLHVDHRHPPPNPPIPPRPLRIPTPKRLHRPNHLGQPPSKALPRHHEPRPPVPLPPPRPRPNRRRQSPPRQPPPTPRRRPAHDGRDVGEQGLCQPPRLRALLRRRRQELRRVRPARARPRLVGRRPPVLLRPRVPPAGRRAGSRTVSAGVVPERCRGRGVAVPPPCAYAARRVQSPRSAAGSGEEGGGEVDRCKSMPT